MTLADTPLFAPPAPPSAAEMVRAARTAPDGRAVFHGVTWEAYQSTLQAVGDGWPRLTYDDGELELRMPHRDHEKLKWSAGRFVEVYMDVAGIAYDAVGSMTLQQESRRGGLEADESYYIQSLPLVEDKEELDLAVDPPPDLAIEIDLSPPAVKKASIYARLGVPEIWRWRNGRLTVHALAPDPAGGLTYALRDRSIALPDFPLALLAAELARKPRTKNAQAVESFRAWCRTQAATEPAES